jgi:membrane-associated phospholipid phosphatase
MTAYAPSVEGEAIRRRDFIERLAITIGVATLFIGGYFLVAYSVHPERISELPIPLDQRVPFIPQAIWIYLSLYPAALIPLFVVRCERLFRRTAIAYAIVISISLIFFESYPVTSARLRASTTVLSVARPSDWLVAKLYMIDPPYNLFPSLHLSIALLAAISAWKAKRLYGAVVYVSVGPLAMSVCAVKQHFVLDVVGGLALAALVGSLIITPYRAQPGVRRSYTWRGPIVYCAVLILLFAGLYTAYLLNRAPMSTPLAAPRIGNNTVLEP